jgi:hypothetical protein
MKKIYQFCLYALVASTITGLSIAAPTLYGQTSSDNTTLAKANSTSLLPSELSLKKGVIFSVITQTPWIGKVNQNIQLDGYVQEALTGKPLEGLNIKLDAHLLSITSQPIKKINVPPTTTDQLGHYKFNVSADRQGVIKAIATFAGSGTHYPSFSLPALVSIFP